MLNKLVNKLYNERGNILFINDLKEFSNEELQDLLDTSSKNKNLVKWTIKTVDNWYLQIQLTNLWIRYYENWFKFDREIEKKCINFNIKENHWNIAWINNWTQNINNQVDEIIKILDKKDIEQKEEMKRLLEEYKKNWDKKSLEKTIWILWSLSSAWSLVVWLLWLLT